MEQKVKAGQVETNDGETIEEKLSSVPLALSYFNPAEIDPQGDFGTMVLIGMFLPTFTGIMEGLSVAFIHQSEDEDSWTEFYIMKVDPVTGEPIGLPTIFTYTHDIGGNAGPVAQTGVLDCPFESGEMYVFMAWQTAAGDPGIPVVDKPISCGISISGTLEV
jgi:hypothetical protein